MERTEVEMVVLMWLVWWFNIRELKNHDEVHEGFIWAKYEEIENFETVAGFSIFTETGS